MTGIRFTKTMKRKMNKRLRCSRKKCAKEWKVKRQLQGIVNKKILECNEKPCNDYFACVDKHSDIHDRYEIEMNKVCTKKMAKKCDKYLYCIQKISKNTGNHKAYANLIECRDKKCVDD